MDSAIHWIAQLVSLTFIHWIAIYPLDSGSAIQRLNNWGLAPVVQKLDNTTHRINHYPLDNSIGFPNAYPLDSDLSGGWRYPTFEQLEPGVYPSITKKWV